MTAIRFYYFATRLLQRLLPPDERALVEEVERIGTEAAAEQTQSEYFRRLSEEESNESNRHL